MCDFCHRHGDGKKWYLQAKNYSRELALRPQSKRMVERVADTVLDGAWKFPGQIRQYQRAPRAVRWLVDRYTNWDLRRNHHGQVVPLEDLRVLLSEVVTTVVRLPCICRKGASGQGPAYCMAITAAPGTWDETCKQLVFDEKEKGRFSDFDVAGLETLAPQEALALLEKFEKEGLVHTLWTFKSPFIGGLCNCDTANCAAMRFLLGGLDVLAPGEYRAEVDADLCKGCRGHGCEKRCPFGAMSFDASRSKAKADARHCYGCGLCRTVCPQKAIRLLPRTAADPPVLLPISARA
jgi:Pyruvate/2-oxoacid:ferredoxin oxidoreductase delta subunit